MGEERAPLSASGGSPSVSRWRCALVWSPLGRGAAGRGRSPGLPWPPPDHRQGAPAECPAPCSFICPEEAGGRFSVPCRSSQQCIRARPCFSPGATLCPASWTVLASEARAPWKSPFPQVNICAAGQALPRGTQWRGPPQGRPSEVVFCQCGWWQPSGSAQYTHVCLWYCLH